jgi:protein-tyrosine phosphatase
MIYSQAVDIHTHILPALDDGARTMDESFMMAKIAYGEGIRTIVCTPHAEKGYGELIGRAREAMERLKEGLYGRCLPMRLMLGFEVLVCERLLDYKDIGNLSFDMGGRPHMLFELDFYRLPACLNEAVYMLGTFGITPVLAHPERYDYLRHDIAFIKSLKEKGVKLQLNAGSVTKENGPRAMRFAKKLIQNGLADYIATDMHSPDRRGPYIRAAYRQAESWGSRLGGAAGFKAKF